jgi:hypothetical protein
VHIKIDSIQTMSITLCSSVQLLMGFCNSIGLAVSLNRDPCGLELILVSSSIDSYPG